MRNKQKRRMLISAFKTTGADKIIGGYILWFFIAAAVIWLWEPTISSYNDSLWFCFATATSIGYGDQVAVTIIGRVIAVLLSVYSIGVIAIFTAVITSFFTDLANWKTNDSARAFLDELEHLPELSKEELEDISRRVKDFAKRQ